jgi:two-component system sensor histidine kinase MprB
MDGLEDTLSKIALVTALVAVAGVATAALLGWGVARTALRPVDALTAAVQRVASTGDFSGSVPVEGSGEIANLASAFNRMLSALAAARRAQRRLIEDASHELRTPLASLRTNAEILHDVDRLPPAARREVIDGIVRQLEELTALVGDVVELARGNKPSGAAGDVRLDEVVREALERARRRAPGLSFEQVIESTLVRGEADRISRAVTNLLDNATKWSPEGGTIEVSLHDGTVTVRDHGPGFKAEDLPFVFDRFHRASEARSKPGSGLGLAIVRQAAEAHDGFAEAANAPDGGAILRVGFGPRVALEELPAEPAVGARQI